MPSASRSAPPSPGTCGWRTPSSPSMLTSSACTSCRTGRACSVETAVDYSFAQFRRLQKAFPGKPIVVAEIGWPSRGRTRESAVASDSNEALFLRRFLKRARKRTDRLLRHGSLRSALEGLPGGRRRVVLGRVRREPQSEVRIPQRHRAGSGMARTGGDLDRGRAPGVGCFVFEQRYAAQPGAQLPGARGVYRRRRSPFGCSTTSRSST